MLLTPRTDAERKAYYEGQGMRDALASGRGVPNLDKIRSRPKTQRSMNENLER